MISYPNGPAQAKDRPGLGICFGWNGRLRWWLRISLGGWLGTSDACGRSPWHAGSGRPPESAQKRGAFHRIPLPHFRPDLTRRTRPGTTKATPATVNTHRRTATPPTKGETSPRTHPSRNPRGGTQPRDPTQPVPCPSSPPVAPAGTAPTHRSRTNPGHRTDRAGTRPRDPIQPVPCPSSPPRHPSGDRANPPIPDQPGHRTARAGTPRRDPTQQPPELPPVRRIPDLRWPPATGKGSCPCVRAPSSRVPSSCRRVGSSGAKPVAELAKELRISESCLRNWLAGPTRTRVVAGRGRVVRRRRNWPSCAGTSGGWRLEILERAAAYFARRRSSARFDTARSPSMTAVSAASPFSRPTNLMISRRLRS